MVKKKASNPSVFSAIQKLRELLSREEKIKWLFIVVFALVVSVLEVVAASTIIMFAQVLIDPLVGQKYFQKIGITESLSSGQIVLYVAVAVGIIFLIKNLIAAFEVFFQNFSIQRMCYEFKNKLLHSYAQADYGFYLTRKTRGDIPSAYSYECKLCTIKRIVKKRKSKVSKEEWYYPDW